MKKLYILLLMLMGVSAFGQKQKFIIIKSYKNGIATVSKVIPIKQPQTINVTQIKYVPQVRFKKSKPQIVKEVEYKLVNVPTAPTALDTVAILQQYYPKNVHREVLTLEEGVGNVVIIDTISHNRLVSRRWIADVKPRIKERIVEVYRPKTVQWYIGPNFTSNVQQPFLSFGASILRKSLNDNIFQISIGTTVHEGIASPTPYFGFGGYIKIK
jgi:hypothetical protein